MPKNKDKAHNLQLIIFIAYGEHFLLMVKKDSRRKEPHKDTYSTHLFPTQ